MNKEELIKKIHDEDYTGLLDERERAYNEGLNTALCYAQCLDEPEKPIVPQFVADWYEDHKNDLEFNIYDLCVDYHNNKLEDNELREWFRNDSKTKPIETLMKMKFYGYEVQKEKLYTVEIPNTNGIGYTKTYLAKNDEGKVELYNWSDYTSIEFADNWKLEENAQLTEEEIKEDYEWAFQFAEEVEE